MIESLRIENIAILERADLDFGPGLNVLTGETGAGKSIVLGALQLLAGARARADWIGQGGEEAVVEALFRTDLSPELEAELAQRGLEAAEHELIVRRSVSRGGRSRARIGGELVPAATLAELFQGRLEISSQHDSQALLRPELHGELLDRLGGLLPTRAAVGRGFAALRALDEELAQLRARTQERSQRADFLAFQLREIDEARLDAAELAGLRVERERLAHAGRLGEEGTAVLALLTGEGLGEEGQGASDRLGEAARRMAELGRIDPQLGAFGERLAALEAELREAALDLERNLDGLEADPGRLAQLEERLHQVERLQRKYGAGVEEVLAFRDQAAAELAGLEGADEREESLRAQREEQAAALLEHAKRLSEGRRKAGRKLGRAVQAALRELGMPDARFAVAFEPADPPEGMPCAATGSERPEFRFSANPGEALRSFRRVVSGGELSRAFLAVQGALRENAAGMVLIFDEVDAGVGGRAADRVGAALAELAAHHQVLCITHLPQIAAFATTHLRVEKRTSSGRTQVRIARVEGDERVEEIARMAGGEAVGEATLRHARELLASRGAAGS